MESKHILSTRFLVVAGLIAMLAFGAAKAYGDLIFGDVVCDNFDERCVPTSTLKGWNLTDASATADTLTLTYTDAAGVPDQTVTFQGGGAGEANVQADWNETSTSSDAFILNKPTIPGSFDLHDDVTTQASSINPTDRFLIARESVPGDPNQYGTGALVASFVLNQIIDSDIPATIARTSALPTDARLVPATGTTGHVLTKTPSGSVFAAASGGGTADGVVNSVAMNVNANTLTVSLGRTVGGTVSGQTTIPGADGVTASGACSGNDLVLTRTRGLANVTIQEACVGAGSGAGEANVQADFAETDSTSDAFILNKPDILVSHRDGHGPPTADPTTAGQVQVNNDGDVFPAGDVVHHYTATPTIVSAPFSNSDWEFWNNVHESVGVPIHPAGVRTNALHFYWNSTGHNFYQNVSGTVRLTTWAQALARIASSGETIPAAIAGRVFLGAFDDEDDAAYALSRRDDRSDNEWVLIYEGFAATDTLARVTSHTDGGVTRTDQPFWRNRLASVDDIANLGSASTLDWGTAAGDIPVLLAGGLLDRARLPVASSVGQGAVVLALPEEVVAAGTGNDVLTAGHIPALLALSDLTLTDEETEVGTGVRSLDCSGEGIDCTFAGTTGTLVVHGERQIDLTYSLAHTATDPESQVAAAIGPAFLAATDMTLHRYRFTVTVPAGAVNIRSFGGLYGKVTRVSATSYTADGDMQTAQMRNITDGDADYVTALTVRQCNACVIEALIPGDGFSVSKGEYFALGVSNFTAGGNARPPFIHVFDGAAAPEDSHIGDDAYPFAPFAWAFKWSRATDEQVDDGDQVYHNARYRDRIEVDYEAGAPGLLRVDKDGTQQYLGPPHLNFAGAGCTVAENATTGAADVTCTGGSTTGITQAQGDARYLQLTGGDITGATTVIVTGNDNALMLQAPGSGPSVIALRTAATGAQKAFQALRGTEGTAWASFEGTIGGDNDGPGFALGPGSSGRDVNLYRGGADILETDDAFRADTLAVTGTLATTQTNLGLNNACVDIGYAGTTLTCTQADGGTDTVTIAGGTGTDLENVATSILPDSDGSHGVGSAVRTFAFGHFDELTVDTTLNIPDSSVAVGKLSATGTPSATTYLRGDGAWETPAGGTATDLTNVTTDILPSADTTRNVGTTARTFASGHFQAMTVDNILTLGTRSLGDAYVQSSIAGQVITFIQADGTTNTITIPRTDLGNVAEDILPDSDGARGVGSAARTFNFGHFGTMNVDTALNLGSQDMGDAYVGQSIAGQVVTFTQADGTTETLTVPGGGGTADGVIDGATLIWNASTSTMGIDISRSVGANIQSGAAISRATATTSGLTEYATDAETTAGTSSIRSLTPANIAAIRLNASQVNAGTMATARLANGTASGTTFLRGDQQWAVPPIATPTDFTSITTNVTPSIDDTGAVGTLGRTWANGRFTALTVDGRFTATGGAITVGGITVQGDLTAQNDIHLGDRDQIILGNDSDATFDFDDRTSHVEIRLNAGATGFVIYDGVGVDVVHEFDKNGDYKRQGNLQLKTECSTQAAYNALATKDAKTLYVIAASCPS